MAVSAPSRRLALLLLACIGFAGCTQQDSECLARIGRKVVERSQGTLASVRQRVDTDLPALPQPGLKEKVEMRLRWDAQLKDTRIEVQASGGEVSLAGTVTNEAQRRRAADVAESTDGVEAVNDRLKVREP